MHSKYGQIKGQIDKEYADLQLMLNNDQLAEIKKSLRDKFKQMAPMVPQRKKDSSNHITNPTGVTGVNRAHLAGRDNPRSGGVKINPEETIMTKLPHSSTVSGTF